MTREEILDEAQKTVHRLADVYRPRIAEVRTLDQLASIHRQFVEEKNLVLQPYIRLMEMLPPDVPIVFAEELR
jgi:hypothetical protein